MGYECLFFDLGPFFSCSMTQTWLSYRFAGTYGEDGACAVGRDPTRLGNLIEQVIGSLGLGEKFHGWRIVSRWPDIVGAEIALHARAVRFSDGILTVVVEKDVWRQELEMQLESILDKVRSQSGGKAVKKIVLRAGSTMESKND
jgi:predicted nucleic acid-binding Zn ribbon protein